jgi:hypothetical protein
LLQLPRKPGRSAQVESYLKRLRTTPGRNVCVWHDSRAVVANSRNRLTRSHYLTLRDYDVLNVSEEDAHTIRSPENDSARSCPAQRTRNVDRSVRMNRIHHSVKRCQYALVPPNPIRVSRAGTAIERRKTSSGPAAKIKDEAVSTERVTNERQLSYWMLETYEVLAHYRMNHYRSDAVEWQDSANLCPSEVRRGRDRESDRSASENERKSTWHG